ncbi:MAG: 5'-nucleotidase, partial [Spirochaetales bacterium]
KKIKVVGFDMDYTLVDYNTAVFEKLAHSLACRRLVEQYGYPEIVRSFAFDNKRAIVGLVVDKKHGNLIKLSRYNKVKTAYHGLEEIDFREYNRLYRLRAIDIREADFQSLDTSFSISYAVLFSQIVQAKKDGAKLPDFRTIADNVSECIDSLHRDGSLKNILKSDFSSYVVKDPQTAQMLERLKSYGKKLMVITNSDYSYTRALLNFAINPFLKEHKSWQDVFDLVITFADKPRFFEGPHRFLKIDPKTGLMSNHEGPVSSGIWQGGWFADVQEGFGVPGDEILYFGDHIFGDVVSIKKRCDWRTGLVLGDLDEELEAIRETRNLQEEIDRLMERKTELEKLSDLAEMDRHYGKNTRVPQKQLEEQEKLNNRISELLEKLKSHFNPYWGEILRAGSEESRYAEQVERYACIYMTRVSELYGYSPRTYFRPPRRKLA